MYKVMVVEDEDLIRKGLVYVFDWTKYHCVVTAEAGNGKEALELMEEHCPDIILTDIRMPIMDGLEMLEHIQNKPIESIIITGFAEFDYARRAISYGVTEYLLKPINHKELGRVLEKLCEKIRHKNISELIEDRIQPLDQYKVLSYEGFYSREDYDSRYTPRVLTYIEKHYREKLSIDQVAEALEVSGNYLSKKFKEDICYTFNDFLNRFRIQKALELVMGSDYKIYQIAEMVGFSDYKYFSQVFKNYVHYSPSEFLQLDVLLKE